MFERLEAMSAPFSRFTEFVLELDRLKSIERRTYINAGERLENSAEHSWHVAIAAWALANYLDRDISLGKLLQLALVHDLGELDAGDTFLYSADRADVSAKERDGVSRLSTEHPGMIPDLVPLWDEQEVGATPEARLLKVADRLLPLLHNIASDGKTWREHGIARSQVLAAHAFIEAESPEIFAWIRGQLDAAVANGWLKDE
ncbi:MAG: HD domain-containing protein [Gammaproteobacteria bacterium]